MARVLWFLTGFVCLAAGCGSSDTGIGGDGGPAMDGPGADALAGVDAAAPDAFDCASGIVCGEQNNVCCQSDQLCLFDRCVTGQGMCDDYLDCALDEFCEPTYGQCIRVDDDPNRCIYRPPVGDFAPAIEWQWPNPGVTPPFAAYDQVMQTPAVANLTDDNGDGAIDEKDVPDVIFTSFAKRTTESLTYRGSAVLRVLSGDDGRELAADKTYPYGAAGNMGVAKLDADEYPEIVVASHAGVSPMVLYAMNLVPDGGGGYVLTRKWQTNLPALYATDETVFTSPAFADVDGNGSVEIVSSFGIHAGATGTAICTPTEAWAMPAVADLDGDGVAEIVANGRLYGADCAELAATDLVGVGTYAAIADLVADGGVGDLVPEIVWVRGAYKTGTIELWNVRRVAGSFSMERVWTRTIPLDKARAMSLFAVNCDTDTTGHKACHTGGGPPTIADFDGDGRPEIGTAARWYYIVLETDGTVLWADGKTQDYSSAITGSSVFDFEGDGKAEVVYNDELKLRVYKGTGSGTDADGDGYADAQVLYEFRNTSGTLFEYPLIVDIDNDGNAEIVVGSNNYWLSGDPTATTGIRVFADPKDNWVRTRRIWNQHTYHVTNVEESGKVPTPERANWTVRRLNNYRQNVQPDGLFNAPNLTVTKIVFDKTACPTAIKIAVTIENDGSLGVPAGLWVGLYAVNLAGADPRAFLMREPLASPIPPGGSVTHIFVWDFSATLLPSMTMTTLAPPVDVQAVVDDPPAGTGGDSGVHNECVEDDNALVSKLLECKALE